MRQSASTPPIKAPYRSTASSPYCEQVGIYLQQPRVVRGLSFRYRWMSPMTARRGQYRTPLFVEMRPPLYCIAAGTGSFCFLILLFCSVVMTILLSLHLRFLRPTPKSFRSHFPPFFAELFLSLGRATSTPSSSSALFNCEDTI